MQQQNLTELKGEIGKSTTLMEDFSTFLLEKCQVKKRLKTQIYPHDLKANRICVEGT